MACSLSSCLQQQSNSSGNDTGSQVIGAVGSGTRRSHGSRRRCRGTGRGTGRRVGGVLQSTVDLDGLVAVNLAHGILALGQVVEEVVVAGVVASTGVVGLAEALDVVIGSVDGLVVVVLVDLVVSVEAVVHGGSQQQTRSGSENQAGEDAAHGSGASRERLGGASGVSVAVDGGASRGHLRVSGGSAVGASSVGRSCGGGSNTSSGRARGGSGGGSRVTGRARRAGVWSRSRV